MNRENSEATPEVTSKSELKRQAKALRDLGKKLCELPEPVLLELPIEKDLLEEILFTRSIKSNVARKRQLGFLGGLLRKTDTAPITDALELRHNAARELNARHHRAETWRDHLLEDGDQMLGVLISTRRDADAQMLRQLLRNARAEAAKGKPPSSARKLFRALRELDETEPLPPLQES